jgi:hypothetical protein
VKSPWPHLARNCRPGLGDRVHSALAAVGITPERVSAALGVDDCGCEQRRQLLNQAGYAIGIGTPLDGSATTEPQGDAHAETQGPQ